uniref:Uncharacterized protein n=1 Tax=Spongospora subterranea TaxID=70186 RepID=A0A0H5QLV2_9EUKA|eukprot:CRZ02991.1 hypothetical protein [Spongospora subterranea]
MKIDLSDLISCLRGHPASGEFPIVNTRPYASLMATAACDAHLFARLQVHEIVSFKIILVPVHGGDANDQITLKVVCEHFTCPVSHMCLRKRPCDILHHDEGSKLNQ